MGDLKTSKLHSEITRPLGHSVNHNDLDQYQNRLKNTEKVTEKTGKSDTVHLLWTAEGGPSLATQY